jgi:hypothetical protein
MGPGLLPKKFCAVKGRTDTSSNTIPAKGLVQRMVSSLALCQLQRDFGLIGRHTP